ncbi:hypothetical protein N7453_010918 [Penicillium expansum]|nr:hypothetical protein N7453_010918 [Penicillium expansum]
MACVADTFRGSKPDYSTGRYSMQMRPLLASDPIVRAGRAANYRSCTLEPWLNVELGREHGNASPRMTSDFEGGRYCLCSYWGWAFWLQLQRFLQLQLADLGKELDAHEDMETFSLGNFGRNALCGCHWWAKWFGDGHILPN